MLSLVCFLLPGKTTSVCLNPQRCPLLVWRSSETTGSLSQSRNLCICQSCRLRAVAKADEIIRHFLSCFRRVSGKVTMEIRIASDWEDCAVLVLHQYMSTASSRASVLAASKWRKKYDSTEMSTPRFCLREAGTWWVTADRSSAIQTTAWNSALCKVDWGHLCRKCWIDW